MTLSTLSAVSPIDGRYHEKTCNLSQFFSEYALIYYRLFIEIKWLESLAANVTISDIPPLNDTAQEFLRNLLNNFNYITATKIKDYEQITKHDVKAVEYYLAAELQTIDALSPYQHLIHFACTSEDINNLAYALMLKHALAQVIRPTLNTLNKEIVQLGKQTAKTAMLARTHGQAATPTTVGKEIINFAARLKKPLQQLETLLISAKCNGAVGNYNAHIIAYPEVNWQRHCAEFVQKLGLEFNAYTTQIEPHDIIAELSQLMLRINNILLDYTCDIWSYISLGYFKQKAINTEVGSSTMPHKINPIDFENAEGNLGLANALFTHFANKLPRSRLQRDLSDSTVMRNLGVAFAYTSIAYQALLHGHKKLYLDLPTIHADLSPHWEIITEAIQTVMRRYGISNAYEQMRDLARGNCITSASLKQFIQNLAIPDVAKQRLLQLNPENYTGLAQKLVEEFS